MDAHEGPAADPGTQLPTTTMAARPRIVVGIDGSEGSERALRWAVEEARTRGARVEAVHAWHYPYLPTPPFVPVPEPGTDDVETAARSLLDRVVDTVDAQGLVEPVERVLVWRGAASALLDAAHGADLLVVGSRGRGAFVGFVLGSVGHEVAHHAPCPIVIIPTEHATARTPESGSL